MALGINTGLSMLNASNGITESQRALSDAIKRLASGKRINSGADDPAGLVITEKMNSRLIGLGAAIQGNENTINMVRTTEAAAGKVSDLLGEARGLIVDAANTGAADADSRAANQGRLNEIIDSIASLADSAQFGAKKVLDGTLTLTPMTSADGKTSTVNVQGLDTENLGTQATYTAQDGSRQDVDQFKNLGDLKTALTGGDQNAAAQALGVVDKAIGQVADLRGKLGALETDSIGPMIENFKSAYNELQSGVSSISDSDFAKEISRVTKENIQSQVKVALMAQGKDNAQTLLQLLM